MSSSRTAPYARSGPSHTRQATLSSFWSKKDDAPKENMSKVEGKKPAPREKKDGRREGPSRASRKDIADTTLKALDIGSFTVNGAKYDLTATTEHACRNTVYYAHDATISWASEPPSLNSRNVATISILEMSTLQGCRYLTSMSPHPGKIAVLNFASAKKPGGGFLSGASAQEESIARSSNLYPCLMTATGQQFYNLHKKDPCEGLYTHAMIYSPSISLFRDDNGLWLEPVKVDMITSAAVNAGAMRDHLHGIGRKQTTLPSQADEAALEQKIEKEMRERMARILFVCESQGAKNLVLGSFGTGVFRNRVDLVASIWASLLNTRFKHSFSKVIFAIMDQKTVDKFQTAYNATTKEI